MKTQEDCLIALSKGYVLYTASGQEVWLDKFGFQHSINRGKKKRGAYTFDSPQYWFSKPRLKS